MRRAGPALALVAAWALAWWLADDSLSDLWLYEDYGTAVLRGELPYRDFAVEYPPLALAPMVLAALGPEQWFEPVFSLLMLACALVAQREVALLAGDDRPAWALAALPLAVGAVAMERFDLLAVALTLVGLRLAVRDHRTDAAFAVLALAVATKLFPLLAVVALAVWLPRGQVARGLAVAAAVVAVICAPFAVAGPAGFAEQARFHLERPVQIESTPAVVARALGGTRVTGTADNPDRFRSQGLEDGATDGIAILAFGVMLVAFAFALGRPPLVATFASVLALVALGKVLSPQYMLWLAPLAAAAYGPGRRAAAALVAAATVLTHVEFPHHYWELVAGDPFARSLTGARDVLLLTALAALLSPRRDALGTAGERAPRLVS